MESIISAYADEFRTIFEKHRSVKDQVVELTRIKSAFENAIDESEKSEAFRAIVEIIGTTDLIPCQSHRCRSIPRAPIKAYHLIPINQDKIFI